MLKTMLWQGALAAAFIGAAAAGYAQVRDSGYLSAPTSSARPDKATRGDHKEKQAGDREHAYRASREGRHHD